jgi:hypothetical protein
MNKVLWETNGKYVPVTYHADIYYNNADLFIVEKIVLIDDGDGNYKRIRLVGRKVSFSDNGAIVARVGSIVSGWLHIGAPVGFSKEYRLCGYVVENESFKEWTSYGEVLIKNVRTTTCPCSDYLSFYSQGGFTECIMNYYTDLLNMNVDIENVDREYIPGKELERAITILILASIKERLV